MDTRQSLAQRASCIREEQTHRLVYRWPLAQVVRDQYPSLQLVWTEHGDMITMFHEHDTSFEPMKK